jgi:hypothetical protein
MTWVIAWREHLVQDEPVGSRAPGVTDSVEVAKKFATHKDASLWAIGLWGDDIFDKDPRVFPISMDQLAALHVFKKAHGRRWKYLLMWEWDRDDCEPELRQLRNALGPRWLYRQRLV